MYINKRYNTSNDEDIGYMFYKYYKLKEIKGINNFITNYILFNLNHFKKATK